MACKEDGLNQVRQLNQFELLQFDHHFVIKVDHQPLNYWPMLRHAHQVKADQLPQGAVLVQAVSLEIAQQISIDPYLNSTLRTR